MGLKGLLKTEAQRKADAQLDEAMLVVCEAYGLLADKTMLDYVAVVEGVTFDDEGDISKEYYVLVFRRGDARTSVALGLLDKARAILLRD